MNTKLEREYKVSFSVEGADLSFEYVTYIHALNECDAMKFAAHRIDALAAVHQLNLEDEIDFIATRGVE